MPPKISKTNTNETATGQINLEHCLEKLYLGMVQLQDAVGTLTSKVNEHQSMFNNKNDDTNSNQDNARYYIGNWKELGG